MTKRTYSFRSRSRSIKRKLRRTFSRYKRPKGRRAGRLMKYNVHAYKRYATAQLFTITAPATAYNSVFTFKLSDVRNSSELTALYDQYMITGCKVRFRLVTNPDAENLINSSVNPSASNFYPKLMYTRDYDNDSVETPNDLRERNTTKMKILRPNQYIDVFVRPAIRNQVYLDGVTTATSPIWKQWLDCSTTQVPHYGLKWCVDFEGFSIGTWYHVSAEIVYYLKFKNTR
jgi:hypothetical protein